MTTRILSWDWRGQPDLDQLARAIDDLSDGRMQMRQVDTGSDEYAIVLADHPLSPQAAEAVWRNRQEMP